MMPSDSLSVWKTISLTIVTVLACSALIGWIAWRYLKNSENQRIVRRRLYRGAGIYALGAFLGVENVISGRAPIWSLLFLPLPIYFVWVYVRAAKQIETPKQ